MRFWKDWAVTDVDGKYIDSFESYEDCIRFLKEVNVGTKFEVEPLFFQSYEVCVTKYCRVQRRSISSGGIMVDKTYVFDIDKLKKKGVYYE